MNRIECHTAPWYKYTCHIVVRFVFELEQLCGLRQLYTSSIAFRGY